MNNPSPFSSLNFRVNPPSLPARLWIIGGAFGVFTVLWLIVPQTGLYWLLLPVIVCLAWAASYGWRPAVVDLIRLLNGLL